jgi:hypothetical protein
MQRVECPDCSHCFNADLPAVGQTCQCPRCGATLSLDAAEDGGPSPEPEAESMPAVAVGSPAPPVVVPPYAAPLQEPESPFDWTPLLRIMAVLFLLAALCAIPRGNSAAWFACFLITFLILSVQQLTRAVESSNRRAGRQPSGPV